MAKNKVNIDVKVDDKGSLKKVGKSAQSARRQIGGVARTASAGGKQFSKMSQGITGGLVPAYAQLAATLFAVDAVFRALKDASDLRVQREGMLAYASSTGIAMQSVAISLQEATDAQLSFKEAASASAIGLAAGMTAEQMSAIGVAAKNASVALGRNFTDSFDRVLKGIVKGEPELLDELGIILRLETATRKYAQAMGLNQDKLTAWQRSQAVFNEVIGQATEKYAALGEGVKVSGIVQLATALEDIKNTAMEAIAPIAEFFAGVFTNNIKAAIALLLVFVASIMNKIVPSLKTMKGEIATLGTGMGAGFKRGVGGLALAGGTIKGAYQTATATPAALASRTQKAAGAFGPSKSANIQALADGKKLNAQKLGQTKAMLKRAEAEYKKHGKITTGHMAGENIKKVRHLRQSIKNMDSTVSRHGVVWKSMWGGVKVATKVTMMTLVGIVKGSFSIMKIAAKGLGMAMNAAMRMAGFIGMAVMMWEMWKSLKERMDKILKWIGEKLKWVAQKFKDIGASLKKTGIGFIAGSALEGLGNLADGWGDAAIAKGEYLAVENELIRKNKEIQNEIDKFTDKMKKSRDEMKKMTNEFKKGFDSIWDEMKWRGNFSQTAGSAFATDLGTLVGIAKAGEISKASLAINELSKSLYEASGIDSRYGEVADELLLLRDAGDLTEEKIKSLLNTILKLNNDMGQVGNSMKEIANLTKEFSRAIVELNKGIGNTRWDRVHTTLEGINRNIDLVGSGVMKNTATRIKDLTDLETTLTTSVAEKERELNKAKARKEVVLGAGNLLKEFKASQSKETLEEWDQGMRAFEYAQGMAKRRADAGGPDKLREDDFADVRSYYGGIGEKIAKGLFKYVEEETSKSINAVNILTEGYNDLDSQLQTTSSSLKKFQTVQDKGIDAILLADAPGDDTQMNALMSLAESLYGPEYQNNIKTFGDLKRQLAGTQEIYNNLLVEERGYQLQAIDIQGRLKEASKWKGPFGQLTSELINIEQKGLDLDIKRLGVKAAEAVLRESEVGGTPADVSAARHALLIATGAVDLAKKELEIYKQSIKIGFKFANDLQAGFTNLWNNVIDGTKSLKDVLKATFRQIFIQLAQMIAQMLMVKALQAAIGWWAGPVQVPMKEITAANAMSGMTGSLATGGIVGKKKIEYFGHGGLAKSLAKGTDTVPAMLTPGETVLTPSQLKNLIGNSAAMASHNVTVNVSAQGQQQTTSTNPNSQAEIGRLIADAVTATLIEEQRPGGVLSPFGGGTP